MNIIFSIISGIFLIFALPPFNLGWLSWFCLVPFLTALNNKRPIQGFVHGLITGLVYFSGILYSALHIGVLGCILLVIYQALYFALFGLLFALLTKNKPSGLRYVFSASFLWVLIEYIRSQGAFGSTWGLLAYSQWNNIPLIQISDITGVYGVSFLVFIINAAISYFISQFLRQKKLLISEIKITGIAIAGIFFLVFLYGINAVSRYSHSRENETRKINVTIVQPNIDKEEKWQSSRFARTMQTYIDLTQKIEEKPDLVIWPETAITESFNSISYLPALMEKFVKFKDVYLLTGILDEDKGRNYNRAVLFAPDGKVVGKYDKIHLFPFAEFIPFPNDIGLSFFKKTFHRGYYSPGKEYAVFDTPMGKISCIICFESIFPQDVRRFVKHGAEYLINITNDAWFGKSNVPYQHFAINVFRAVENRIEIARCANTGISGFIDAAGRPRQRTSIFTQTTINSTLTPRLQDTFYTRFGDIFSYMCILGTIVFLTKRKPEKKDKASKKAEQRQ